MEILFRDHPEIAPNGSEIAKASGVKNYSKIVHFSDYLLLQEKVSVFFECLKLTIFRMRFTEIDQCGTPPQSPKIFLSCFQKAPRIFALKSFSSKILSSQSLIETQSMTWECYKKVVNLDSLDIVTFILKKNK